MPHDFNKCQCIYCEVRQTKRCPRKTSITKEVLKPLPTLEGIHDIAYGINKKSYSISESILVQQIHDIITGKIGR